MENILVVWICWLCLLISLGLPVVLGVCRGTRKQAFLGFSCHWREPFIKTHLIPFFSLFPIHHSAFVSAKIRFCWLHMPFSLSSFYIALKLVHFVKSSYMVNGLFLGGLTCFIFRKLFSWIVHMLRDRKHISIVWKKLMF